MTAPCCLRRTSSSAGRCTPPRPWGSPSPRPSTRWRTCSLRTRDNQAVATFSGVFATGRTGGEDGLGDYATVNIPRPENRWLGGNRGGWSNPAYDRAWEAFTTRLDRSERIQQIAQMERLLSEDVGAIPLFYTPRMIAHVAGLRGPVARTSRDAMELVHVDKWEWVQ